MTIKYKGNHERDGKGGLNMGKMGPKSKGGIEIAGTSVSTR